MRIKALKIMAVVSAIAWLASSACGPATVAVTNGRKPAPNFSRTDANGATVRLSDFHGKVVLLNFWATTCGGCKVEIPWFVEYQQKYAASGLAVIGVSMDDGGWKLVKPYLQSHQLNYPIVVAGNDMPMPFDGVQTLPVTFLIDRHGKVVKSHTGMVDRAACEADIRTLLGEL